MVPEVVSRFIGFGPPQDTGAIGERRNERGLWYLNVKRGERRLQAFVVRLGERVRTNPTRDIGALLYKQDMTLLITPAISKQENCL